VPIAQANRKTFLVCAIYSDIRQIRLKFRLQAEGTMCRRPKAELQPNNELIADPNHGRLRRMPTIHPEKVIVTMKNHLNG
jgi:hypothetical protein